MRRQVWKTALGLPAALGRDSGTTNLPPHLYICPRCMNAVNTHHPPISRVFSEKPTRHQDSGSKNSPKTFGRPETYYDLFPQTFPSGPPPHTPFSPDLKQLRKEFVQAQSKAHPDLAPGDQKHRAEALSARINEAYRVLQDPLKRAQHLLSMEGINVEDESAKLSGGELLTEVMEAREAVEEAEDEEELAALRDQNNKRIADSVRVLEDAFAHGDLGRAAREAVRLRYWKNIEESIHGWERGRGGGVLHH